MGHHKYYLKDYVTGCVEPLWAFGCLVKVLKSPTGLLSQDVCDQGTGHLFSLPPNSLPPNMSGLFDFSEGTISLTPGASPLSPQISINCDVWVTFTFPLSFLLPSILRERLKMDKKTEVLQTQQDAQPQTWPQTCSSSRAQSTAHYSPSSTYLLLSEQKVRPAVNLASKYPEILQFLGAYLSRPRGGTLAATPCRPTVTCLIGHRSGIQCQAQASGVSDSFSPFLVKG